MPARGHGAFTFICISAFSVTFVLLLLLIAHGEGTPVSVRKSADVSRTVRYRQGNFATVRQIAAEQLGDIKATGGAAVEEVPSDTLEDYTDYDSVVKQENFVLYTSATTGPAGSFQETSRITKEKIEKERTTNSQGGSLALKFASPAAIIGMSIGGFLLAVLVVLSCCCCCRCCNKQ